MVLAKTAVLKKLDAAVDAGYQLSTKLYRVLQLLPSAVYDYAIFADQTFYLAANLEKTSAILKREIKVEDNSQLLKDIETLLKLVNDGYAELKEALPSRPFEGGIVEMFLPLDPNVLIDQSEALGLASTVLLTVLELVQASDEPTPRFYESLMYHLKSDFANMTCTQPKNRGRPGAPIVKRGKLHGEIVAFFNTLLTAHKISTETAEDGLSAIAEEVKEDGEEDREDGEKKETEKKDEPAQIDYFGADPKADGMPSHLIHHPDNVYAKLHTRDVDERSLKNFALPYSKPKENDKYWIIWRQMDMYECDNVINHTKKLRINEEYATVTAQDILGGLSKRWGFGETAFDKEENALEADSDFKAELDELAEFLEDIKKQDENRGRVAIPNRGRAGRRVAPAYRSYSYSPSPIRPVPVYPNVYNPAPPYNPYAPRRGAPGRRRYRSDSIDDTSRSEYWRSWGDQPSHLHIALKSQGWQPVYMRGTEDGQTWFYGGSVCHVRRFAENYTPQDGLKGKNEDDGSDSDSDDEAPRKKKEENTDKKEYLVIGNEWVEKEALDRHGFRYQLLPSGHFALDPRLTWGDIELVVSATATFREERLYKKYRNAPKGDLHEPAALAIPDLDYLNGLELGQPPMSEQPAYTAPRVRDYGMVEEPRDIKIEMPAVGNGMRKIPVKTPSVESHDSFVDVGK